MELVKRAFVLEWITIGWMVIEATIAIWTGVSARSLMLIAFGADSVIELVSAGVLLWRISVELEKRDEFPEQVERQASRIGGVLLLALALYVILSGGWNLWTHKSSEFSAVGLTISVLAIPIMYFLSKAKMKIADDIGSKALRTDAVESITCGYLSFVVVVGLLAQLVLRAWWIDSVASLGIVYFLIKEGREALVTDECCGNL